MASPEPGLVLSEQILRVLKLFLRYGLACEGQDWSLHTFCLRATFTYWGCLVGEGDVHLHHLLGINKL